MASAGSGLSEAPAGLYLAARADIAAQAPTGTNRAAFISAAIGSGNTISVRRRSIPSAMARAASSASMMNGIGKLVDRVISVRTKPGQTVVTRTPRGAERRPQRLEQIDLRGLGGAVRLGSGHPAVSGNRGDPHDVAAAVRGHRRDDRGEQVVQPEQVDLDVSREHLRVPLCGVELLPVAGAPHRDVEAAERFGHIGGSAAYGVAVGGVERRPPSSSRRHGFEVFRPSGADRDLCAAADELGRERGADSARGSDEPVTTAADRRLPAPGHAASARARVVRRWTLETDLGDVQVAGCETGLAVSQIELPLVGGRPRRSRVRRPGATAR